jgi:hypothetical protein
MDIQKKGIFEKIVEYIADHPIQVLVLLLLIPAAVTVLIVLNMDLAEEMIRKMP